MLRRNKARRGVVVLTAAALAVVVTASAALAHEPGRMTGGGSVFTSAGMRVTHGFEIHCIYPEGGSVIEPNNLQVNWGKGNSFHLEELIKGACSDDPKINPLPRVAPFDTYSGAGYGRYNGVSGAYIEWNFTDAGEPGKKDRAKIKIWVNGTRVLTVDGLLKVGNHQAHPENKA